jgi:antitoxin ParD1/3/4
MHVNLSPEMEGFIKAKVATGFYGNATEVIRDAIRRMQVEEKRVTEFRAAVARGDAQLNAGQGIRYTPEVSANILKEGLARANANESVTNSDVLP